MIEHFQSQTNLTIFKKPIDFDQAYVDKIFNQTFSNSFMKQKPNFQKQLFKHIHPIYLHLFCVKINCENNFFYKKTFKSPIPLYFEEILKLF